MKVHDLVLLLALAPVFNFARAEHSTRPPDVVGYGGNRRSSSDPATSARQRQRQQQRPRQIKVRRERKDCHGAQGTPLPVQAAAAALSSAVGNATQALLPFAPLIVEAPALMAHARRAWPWLRAAAALRPFPFAFVTPPAPAPQRRKGALRRKRHTAPLRRRPARVEVSRAAARCRHRQRPTLAEIAKADLNVACSIRGLGSAASSDGVGVSSCRASSSSGIGNAASSVSRREAIENAVSLVGRWGAASAWLAVVGGGEAAAAAEPSGSIGVATGAGVAAGDGGFGSKAFTEKSYDGFAGGYDDLDGGWAASAIGMEDLRSKLLARAAGCVLEVGVGTGLNLRHYPRNGVTSIDAVDLSPGMLRQASARSASLGMGGLVRLQQMDVEDLKFPSGTFDTVVDTFSLCVFTDPSAALREMARVCKPTGRVLLLENSKSGFGPLAAYQDVTASYLADKGGAKGCFWNQDVEGLARGAGLRVERSSPALPGGLFRTLECVPA